MIKKFLSKHPSLHHAKELDDICNPLSLLGIHYFAHVHIDNKKRFSAISSNPLFSEHYLNNHYYNSDIHMVEKNLGKYVVWDFVNLKGRSLQMHQEAGEFGIKHTFTIVQKGIDGSSDFYHFASNISHYSNQNYFSNLHLLKIFILNFKEKIHKEKHLLSAYDLKISPKNNFSYYSIDESNFDISNEFIKQLSPPVVDNPLWFDLQFNSSLSLREKKYLYHYIHGKSPRDIADLFFVSRRTIEQYMQNIKIKLNVNNKTELIEKVLMQIQANL